MASKDAEHETSKAEDAQGPPPKKFHLVIVNEHDQRAESFASEEDFLTEYVSLKGARAPGEMPLVFAFHGRRLDMRIEKELTVIAVDSEDDTFKLSKKLSG